MKLVNIQLDLKNVIIIIASLLLVFLIFKIQGILAPFAISFFVAYLLNPVVKKMEKFKIGRSLAILILFLITISIIALASIFLFPVIYKEIVFLSNKIPEYIANIIDYLQRHSGIEELNITKEHVVSYLKDKSSEISSLFFSAFSSVYSSVSGFIGRFVSYSLVPILIFYFLRDFDSIMSKGISTFKEKFTYDIEKHVNEFNAIISRYFRGQIAVSLILAVLYSTVLMISGIKGGLGIGLISGILSIVPYLGFIMGFSTSLIVAYFQYLDILHPLYVVIGFTIVQFIESNFITPKLVGGSLGLHPTAVIFSLVLGGYLLGIAGMIISLPVAAFIKIIFMNYFNSPGDGVMRDA